MDIVTSYYRQAKSIEVTVHLPDIASLSADRVNAVAASFQNEFDERLVVEHETIQGASTFRFTLGRRILPESLQVMDRRIKRAVDAAFA